MLVMTLRFGTEYHEIHMLNPGESFPNFGGSRHSLIVNKKTASIVVRRRGGLADIQEDTEYSITEPKFWMWFTRMLNDTGSQPDEAISGLWHKTLSSSELRDRGIDRVQKL